MTEILSIRLGKEGDSREYLGEGWRDWSRILRQVQ
jgi:hypothetical protein